MQLNDAPILLIFGLLFLLGLATDLVGRHSVIPRVTLLIVAGLAVGPIGLDLLPETLVNQWFPLLTTLALSLVGFLVGEKLSFARLRAHGRLVISITLGTTFLALGAGLGVPMAYLTGRIRPGEPTLAEAIGFVLLCG